MECDSVPLSVGFPKFRRNVVSSSKIVGSKNRCHLEVARAYVDSVSRVEMANSGELIQFLLLVHGGGIYLFIFE